jgi:hypothetical protein
MGTKRIKELVAIVMIGDGVLSFAAPRRYTLLWEIGPEGFKRAIEAFAEHPTLTRVLGAAEAGLGFGLAFRQYTRG